MLGNYGENIQASWVSKNGKKQPKIAKIGQHEFLGIIVTTQIGVEYYILIYFNVR